MTHPFRTATAQPVLRAPFWRQTVLGKALVIVVIVVGVIFLAMPLATVGDSFAREWDARHFFLLQRCMRQLAVESGLSVANGPKVFENLGARDGRIELDTFGRFVRHTLRLDLSSEEMAALFRRLDILGRGAIPVDELCKLFFRSGAHTSESE
jgi:hypothetical protein